MDNTCTDCNELVRYCRCRWFVRRNQKPMSLAQQVADARRIVASWPDEQRRNVQLEGYDYRKPPNVLSSA